MMDRAAIKNPGQSGVFYWAAAGREDQAAQLIFSILKPRCR